MMDMENDRESRRFERYRGRLPCVVLDESQESNKGFVTDLSANGLFLQTTQHLPNGTRVTLQLDLDGQPTLTLLGCVARERKSHRTIGSVAYPGVGIKLDSAPEAYFQLMIDLSRES
jgi:hypothetical protein